MSEQDVPLKLCTGPCGQEYPATAEYWHRDRGRFRSRCKECVSTQNKIHDSRPEVQEQHRNRRREYMKTYRQRPDVQEKERISAEKYRSRPEVQEHRKEYYSRPEIQEHEKEYRKEYYSRPDIQEHRGSYIKDYRNRPETQARERANKKIYHQLPEVKERRRAYYSRPEARSKAKTHRNRPEVKERELKHHREYHKSYYARPGVKDAYSARSHMRHARKKSVKGTYTSAQIQDQLKRQKHKCYYCQKRLKKVKGKYIYHIEHTFPISRVAGTDIPANSIDYLVIACPTCNIGKKDKYPWEWPEGGRLL